MKRITIEHKGYLPSVNHMYGRGPFGSVYLKPEGKLVKQSVLDSVNETLTPDVELGYELEVYGNWYNKGKAKTHIKRKDTNNLVKLIVDACCEAIGVDDSQIFKERQEKKESNEPGFKMEIYELTEDEKRSIRS
jgi:Holliday junction resolvase RusA-like endonuclease